MHFYISLHAQEGTIVRGVWCGRWNTYNVTSHETYTPHHLHSKVLQWQVCDAARQYMFIAMTHSPARHHLHKKLLQSKAIHIHCCITCHPTHITTCVEKHHSKRWRRFYTALRCRKVLQLKVSEVARWCTISPAVLHSTISQVQVSHLALMLFATVFCFSVLVF